MNTRRTQEEIINLMFENDITPYRVGKVCKDHQIALSATTIHQGYQGRTIWNKETLKKISLALDLELMQDEDPLITQIDDVLEICTKVEQRIESLANTIRRLKAEKTNEKVA